MSSNRSASPGRGWRIDGWVILTLVLLLLVLSPVVWLLMMSLKTEIDALAMPPKLVFVPTLENYIGLLEARFLRPLINSVVVAVTTTLLSLGLGVPAAYVLSRARTWAVGGIAFWILTTRMAPPIAFGIPFFLAYRDLGWLDTLGGLILIYLTFNLSLVVWMMRTFFDAIPLSLEEAAYMDGASTWQAFRAVVLPLVGPGTAATAILCFLLAWNDFFYALVLTRSNAMTAPVAIVNFMNYAGWDWGRITAGSIIVALPVVAFSVPVRRYLISGLTAGAVKG
ncbi:MAG: carbohydrate ABC transporter permease [Candidatus Rokubacteria bacterium]|nr:carbohydrate ABC transporter permease [Candidatus Rokubacteria bacterium]